VDKIAQINILSLNLSEKKGTIKTPVPEITLTKLGIENDAHAGNWHRQVSMLAQESVDRFEKLMGRKLNPGEFAENITSQGLEIKNTLPLDKFIGCRVELEVTQIGKKCHGDNCNIYKETGNCVMPKEGIFLRVTKEGKLKTGETLLFHPKVFRFYVITLSDRASKGEYEDLSGPKITELITNHFNEKRKVKITNIVIPDDAEQLKEQFNKALEENFDCIITTGGTGIGPRDITVETILPLLDKEIPGIMEHIRMKYGSEKPNALLSRGVSGIKNQTLVYTLPGSVKAVNEYMNEILKTFEHLVYMMNGLDMH
jgi:molybdenum cofactor synthesis domain-containing protein